jgi:hypothetical protein
MPTPEENQLTPGQGLPAPVCSAAVDRRRYWAVYFPGMDEWHAKESRAAAKRDAKAINEFCALRKEDYRVRVREWEFGYDRWLQNFNREQNT